ncbi:MAG TPA: DMT family transporter [Chlamydiales bacterium]|nr:DMT family transporter [Chlamydiales bacterium]
MHKKSFHAGVIYTLISASGIALTGLFGKLGASEFSLEALIFWRYLAAFFLCLLTLWLIGKLHHVFHFGNLKLHFLRAFFVLSAQYSFYYYIQRETLMNGLVLFSLGPLSIPFIARVVTGHPIGKSTWIGLIISFVGVVCILQPNGGIFSLLSLIGVLAGLSQGCSQVVFGLTSETERTELSTLYLFFLCAFLSLIPYLLFEPRSEIDSTSYATGLIVLLGLASVLSQLMRAAAYKHGTPTRLSTFLYFSILLGIVFDWLVFDNQPDALSLFGAFLVITGGMLKVYLRSIILKNKGS